MAAAVPPKPADDAKEQGNCLFCGVEEAAASGAAACCASGHRACPPCLRAYRRGYEKGAQMAVTPTCPELGCIATLIADDGKAASRKDTRLASIARLHPQNPDFEMVSKKFAETVKNKKITDVFRIDNPPLRAMYEACRARMTKEGRRLKNGTDVGANEQNLFHATTRAAAGGIIREGFDLSRTGSRIGNALGPGIYLAPEAAFADRYAAMDSVSKCSMLLCRALVGDSTGRDSTASACKGQYCVKRECQVLPEFLIHYEIAAPLARQSP